MNHGLIEPSLVDHGPNEVTRPTGSQVGFGVDAGDKGRNCRTTLAEVQGFWAPAQVRFVSFTIPLAERTKVAVQFPPSKVAMPAGTVLDFATALPAKASAQPAATARPVRKNAC